VLVKNKYKLREEEKNTRRKGGVPSERETEKGYIGIVNA